jgi:alpha-beta hydrolase superfamily lysophospholipase
MNGSRRGKVSVILGFRGPRLARRLAGVAEVATWQPEGLGPGYEMMTLALGQDYEGEVTATLVRRPADPKGSRAVLYVHGYSDYFFQKHVADFYTGLGISFYALDLRKHGRSLLPHQTACLCLSLREYYPEIDAAVGIIKREGYEQVLVSGHSTGGLVVSLWAAEDEHRYLGTASGNRKTPAPELFAVDIVLDVGRIARLSPRLGRNVTCAGITGAIHDVFLSQPAARRRAFDELSNWLTASVPGAGPGAAGAGSGRSPSPG